MSIFYAPFVPEQTRQTLSAESTPQRILGHAVCSSKSESLVRYATGSLPNKMLVSEYLTALPDEKLFSTELEKTRKQLESRA
jgi:hypothetical protein